MENGGAIPSERMESIDSEIRRLRDGVIEKIADRLRALETGFARTDAHVTILLWVVSAVGVAMLGGFGTMFTMLLSRR